MMLFKKPAIVLFSLIITGSSASAEQTKRQHGAHEHGVSKLQMALDNNDLLIELEAPGSDIVGFESKAETDEQKLQIKNALALLEQPFKILEFPSNAGCSITSAEADLESNDEEHHDGKENNHDEGRADHTAFHVAYSFSCKFPKNLTTMNIHFFKLFTNAKEIELQAVSGKGQMAKEIESDETSVDLAPIVD